MFLILSLLYKYFIETIVRRKIYINCAIFLYNFLNFHQLDEALGLSPVFTCVEHFSMQLSVIDPTIIKCKLFIFNKLTMNDILERTHQ